MKRTGVRFPAVLAGISLIFLLLVDVGLGRDLPEDQASSHPQWIAPPVQAPWLEYRVFYSDAATTNVSYHILVPPASVVKTTASLPVLYWLHGGGGAIDEAGGGNSTVFLSRFFRTAMLNRQTPPMMVVFPNGLASGMWCDSKDGRTPVESVLIKDLIPHVESNGPVISAREGRMIEGFSMGGYGAARLGFKYPDMFCAISILGAGPLQTVFSPQVGPARNARLRQRLLPLVYGNDQDYFRLQSPWHLASEHAPQLRRDPPRLRQVIGEGDFTLPANRDFHAHLVALEIPVDFVVMPGIGHHVLALLGAMGSRNGEFYREVFGEVGAD